MAQAAEFSPHVLAHLTRPAPDVVIEWRFDELERLGLDVLDAIRLALDPAFDVAALRSLVAHGCAVALAIRILH